MANTNAPSGLISRRNAAGGQHNDALRAYRVLTTDASRIFMRDAVIKTGAVDADGTPICTLATVGAGNRITGVVEGFAGNGLLNSMALQGAKFRAANVDGYVLVNDDPDALFEIQESGSFGPTMAGKNANLTAAIAGNAYTGVSGLQIDSTSPATSANNQLKVISAEHRVDWGPDFTSTPGSGQNDPTSAYCKWLVKINLHTEQTGQAGV